MKTRITFLVLAIMTSSMLVFGGGEIPTNNTHLPKVTEKTGSSFFDGLKSYFVKRINDFGDVVLQSADAIAGLVGLDIADDDGRN